MVELRRIYGGFCAVEDENLISAIYKINAEKKVVSATWERRSFRKGLVTWHDYDVVGHPYNNIKTMISNGSLRLKEE